MLIIPGVTVTVIPVNAAGAETTAACDGATVAWVSYVDQGRSAASWSICVSRPL
jgi:hypothetical protein